MSELAATIAAQRGPQTEFLRSPADICIYGGAAGGGKTVGLILEPLRYATRAAKSADGEAKLVPNALRCDSELL